MDVRISCSVNDASSKDKYATSTYSYSQLKSMALDGGVSMVVEKW